MKIKNKILFILGLFFIFLLFLNINSVNASVDIPEVVMEKAKELNHGYDNFVVLQDTITKEFYLPYETSVYNESNYQNVSWKYTKYKGVYCLVTPSWFKTGLKVYRNGSFIDTSTNNVGSNSIIQLSMDGIELEIVYSSKDVIYHNIDGVTNGTVFFPQPVTEIPEQETLTTTIPALETVEQIPVAMIQTLKIVIPVGLVIFGTLLLILLVKSVISRVT